MTSPADPSAHLVDVDLDGFRHEVLDASAARPVLVDFWADWCAPCHALAPHLGRVVADLDGRIGLAKVEVDEGENMKLAGQYKLRGFPTVILLAHYAFQTVPDGVEAGSRGEHWMQREEGLGVKCCPF